MLWFFEGSRLISTKSCPFQPLTTEYPLLASSSTTPSQVAAVKILGAVEEGLLVPTASPAEEAVVQGSSHSKSSKNGRLNTTRRPLSSAPVTTIVKFVELFAMMYPVRVALWPARFPRALSAEAFAMMALSTPSIVSLEPLNTPETVT